GDHLREAGEYGRGGDHRRGDADAATRAADRDADAVGELLAVTRREPGADREAIHLDRIRLDEPRALDVSRVPQLFDVAREALGNPPRLADPPHAPLPAP